MADDVEAGDGPVRRALRRLREHAESTVNSIEELLPEIEAAMTASGLNTYVPPWGSIQGRAFVRGFLRGAGINVPAQTDDGHSYESVDARGTPGNVSAVESLLGIVDHPDQELRRRVVGALGRIGDVRAVPALINALSDRDPRVRRRAAIALGQIGDVAPLDTMIAAVSDPDDPTRLHAVQALGALRDTRAVQTLGLVLARPHERWYVRRAAARSLGLLGPVGRAELMERTQQDVTIQPWTGWVLRRLPTYGEVASLPRYIAITQYTPAIRAFGAKRRGDYETDFMRDAPTV